MKRTSIIVTFFSLFFALAIQAQNTLRMNANQRLDKGQKIEVAGKGYLTLQTDGNLVAYTATNAPKWATGTNGRAVTHAIMQTDGNLVIYNGTAAVWSSNSWNVGASNGYFEIDLTTWRVAIFNASGAVAKELQAGVAPPVVNYTVTCFAESGYITRFKMNYVQNGVVKSFESPDMTLGATHKFTLPSDATSIRVMGMYSTANIWIPFYWEDLSAPQNICYKNYGPIGNYQWSHDCPGGAPAPNSNQIKFTHGAGFVANWQITYNQPGKPGTTINPTGTTMGWKNTYTIPGDVSNIRVFVQGATGLIWEPWRTTYDKTFPTPPSGLCVKIYGTTLDQKWNNDCN